MESLPCAQFAEIPAVHQLLHAWLDNFLHYGLDESLVSHNNSLDPLMVEARKHCQRRKGVSRVNFAEPAPAKI